jgi:hypothetical protein
MDVTLGKGLCGPIQPSQDKGNTICYVCNAPIHAKKPHKRSRNGVEHTVRGHFAHNPGSTCNGESFEHLAAKDALVKHAHKCKFVSRCNTLGCTKDMEIHVVDATTRSVEEAKWGIYYLDVGVFDETGTITGAFEVLHTHAVPKEKAEALTDCGISWCEVSTRDVLSALELPMEIVCSQSGAPLFCQSCEETRAKVEIDAKWAAIDTEIKTLVETRSSKELTRTVDVFIRGQVDALVVDHKTKTGRSLTSTQIDSIEYHFKTPSRWGSIEYLDYECLNAITGFVATGSASLEVRTKWKKMVATIKTAVRNSPLKYAMQQLNQDIIDAIEVGSNTQMTGELVATVDHLSSSEPKDVILFGKYTGMTFDQVADHNMKYVKYLARWTGKRGDDNKPEVWSHPHGEFQDRARKALTGLCLECYNGTLSDWKHWCAGCYCDAGNS